MTELRCNDVSSGRDQSLECKLTVCAMKSRKRVELVAGY